MEDLKKVNSIQLYLFWRNLSVGLLVLMAMLAFSRLLPFYLSPVVSLLCAAGLYTMLYNNRLRDEESCMVIPYSIFFCLIVYSFVTIVLNVLFAWGLLTLPPELIFFNDPYVPALLLNPICVLTLTVIYINRHHLSICVDCRLTHGSTAERGSLGTILSNESHFQLRNLLLMFFVLTVLVWSYYLFVFQPLPLNARDWYVFLWATIIAFVLDEVYFAVRYYNLFLDLKENNEIITPEELQDMTAKTYLRFYVVCGNKIFMDPETLDPHKPYMGVLDTPFFTKRSVNGISLDEVRRIIFRMTGDKHGELRFFFGRRSADLNKHSVLRYFYFLDGDAADYPDMHVNGEWVDFEKIKQVYSKTPGKISTICVADISRLATIILTEKIFDENGYRKNKLKSYNPTFNLIDVRNSVVDFQDDKWIKISMFNSDTRLYGLKRWWRRMRNNSDNRKDRQVR